MLLPIADSLSAWNRSAISTLAFLIVSSAPKAKVGKTPTPDRRTAWGPSPRMVGEAPPPEDFGVIPARAAASGVTTEVLAPVSIRVRIGVPLREIITTICLGLSPTIGATE